MNSFQLNSKHFLHLLRPAQHLRPPNTDACYATSALRIEKNESERERDRQKRYTERERQKRYTERERQTDKENDREREKE